MAFYNSINNTSNFAISFTRKPKLDFAIFAKGYHRAAKKLAEHLLSQIHFPDYEAYPVVFLYRHSFELHLKSIIYTSALLCAFTQIEDVNTKLDNRHRLDNTAKVAIAILRKLFPADDSLKIFTKDIQQVADEFCQIDSDSYSYRYPIDTKGNYSTTMHQIVNLEALHATMEIMINGLEAIDIGIDIETNIAQNVYEILETMGNEIE